MNVIFFSCSSLRNIAADEAASFKGALALITVRGVHGIDVLFARFGLLTLILEQLQGSLYFPRLEITAGHLEGMALHR